MLLGIHFDFRLRPQGAQQHALHIAFFGFGSRYHALPHLFRHQRVVARQLQQRAGAQQIGPAVAHVRDAQFRTINPCGRQRRSHAALFRMLFRGFANRLVG